MKTAVHTNLRAVVDIGSNSIRLVIFEDGQQFKRVVHESEACGLGRGLSTTGVLNPDGKAEALRLMQRFAAILREHGVANKHTYVIATEAVRRAKDGKNFIHVVNKQTGLRIKTITGEEEGFFSAYGVACGFASPRGIVGDMGGGSFELVSIKDDKIGKRISLPFGPLPLLDSKNSLAEIRKSVRAELKRYPWLKSSGRNETFYAVGGIFRSLARIYKHEHKDPLDSVHGFALGAKIWQRYLRGGKSKLWTNAARSAGVRADRVDKIPVVLTVLDEVFDYVGFDRIKFSEYGLREGVLATERGLKPDPELLVQACSAVAARYRRAIGPKPGVDAQQVYDFIAPICAKISLKPRQKLLVRAACALMDIGWAMSRPDRAINLLREIAEEPFPQASQHDRMLIALMIFARYGGKMSDVPFDLKKFTPQEMKMTQVVGHALRLADTLCLGASSMLPDLRLVVLRQVLSLELPRTMPIAGGADVPTRLERLADSLGVTALTEQKIRRR
jgi:exopolyphosphatase/guanosine-5'-triphosphate,3'-diphosphate pyrophosphatase